MIQLHKQPLMIDEVQYAPELFPYIKMIVDKNHEPGLFYLTGSQLFKLMEGVKKSLAGRVALLHLSPLANGEILGRQDKRPYDTGLICYLTRWTRAETAMNGAMNGSLLENYVISEMMKSYRNEGLNPLEVKKPAMADKNWVMVIPVLKSQESRAGIPNIQEKKLFFLNERCFQPRAHKK